MTDYNILIVDDNSEDIELYRRILECESESDFNIQSAETGTNALSMCKDRQPDCILLDYMLPDMTGLEFMQKINIKFGHNKFPVIMLTSQGDENIAVAAMKSGCQDYIQKVNISTKSLKPAIIKALENINISRKQNEYRRELERLVEYDELTGLFNRRAILQMYELEYNRALRFNHELTVIMLDIDYFKSINDRHGHFMGDVVLRSFANAISRTTRSIDISGRFGGEEFLIILPGTNMHGGLIIAEKIRSRIERQTHFSDSGSMIKVTCSLGVASIDGGRKSKESVLELSDRALYTAKKNGRNQVASN